MGRNPVLRMRHGLGAKTAHMSPVLFFELLRFHMERGRKRRAEKRQGGGGVEKGKNRKKKMVADRREQRREQDRGEV